MGCLGCLRPVLSSWFKSLSRCDPGFILTEVEGMCYVPPSCIVLYKPTQIRCCLGTALVCLCGIRELIFSMYLALVDGRDFFDQRAF